MSILHNRCMQRCCSWSACMSQSWCLPIESLFRPRQLELAPNTFCRRSLLQMTSCMMQMPSIVAADLTCIACHDPAQLLEMQQGSQTAYFHTGRQMNTNGRCKTIEEETKGNPLYLIPVCIEAPSSSMLCCKRALPCHSTNDSDVGRGRGLPPPTAAQLV